MMIFGFDPNQAAINIVDLLKYIVLFAGIVAAVGFLAKGKVGITIGTILATAFIYFILSNNSMGTLGQELSNILTINTTQSQTQTTTGTTSTQTTTTGTNTPQTSGNNQ